MSRRRGGGCSLCLVLLKGQGGKGEKSDHWSGNMVVTGELSETYFGSEVETEATGVAHIVNTGCKCSWLCRKQFLLCHRKAVSDE